MGNVCVSYINLSVNVKGKCALLAIESTGFLLLTVQQGAPSYLLNVVDKAGVDQSMTPLRTMML